MLQPTGSVYLDAPRGPRPTDTTAVSRTRSTVAGILAGAGLLCLTLAAVLGGFRALVHDPATVVEAVNQAIDDPAGRLELEAEIAEAIDDTLFGEELTTALAGFGIDIEAESERIAPIVLDDPAFRAALTDLVIATHEQVLLEPTDEPLDMTEITSAVRAILVAEIPEAAAALPASNTLYIVTADQIPDLSAPMDLLDRAALAVAAGGLLLPLAALAHPHHHRVLSWIGRWLLALGLTAGLAAVALPWISIRLTGFALIELVTRELSTRLLIPAGIAGAVGMGLATAAGILKNRETSKTADEGVAAALGGLDEALLISGGGSQQMDLAQRGLVDVSHPLTNI